MEKKKYPSQKALKQILKYNPFNGCFVWKWRKDAPLKWNRRYAHNPAGKLNKNRWEICINYVSYQASILAWIYMTGELPLQQVDHKDTDSTNNIWKNLRCATQSQNQRNKRKYKNNKSGYKGVSWDKQKRRWTAQLRFNGKNITLGRFDTPEKAHAKYVSCSKKFFKEFARSG